MSLTLRESGVAPEDSTVVFKEMVSGGTDPRGYDRPPRFVELGKGEAVLNDGKIHAIYVFDEKNDWRNNLQLGHFQGYRSGGSMGLWQAREEIPLGGSPRPLLYRIEVISE